MEEMFKVFNLTENEIKVYKTLLKIKKGTKTPLVRESGVLSSKVYEILDRLIQKGLVATFIENRIKNYVPVDPVNIKYLFDEKIKEIERQKQTFEENIKNLFPEKEVFHPNVQLFKSWKGLRSVFNILLNDLKKNDTYYVLGANPGENKEKAIEFFYKIDKELYNKKVKIKAISKLEKRKEAEEYLKKYGKKSFNIKYYKTTGPFEIVITNNYVLFLTLEENPTAVLMNDKSMRESFIQYFKTIWKLSEI